MTFPTQFHFYTWLENDTVSDFESLRSLLHPKTLPGALFPSVTKLAPATSRKHFKMEAQVGKSSTIEQVAPIDYDGKGLTSSHSSPVHAQPETTADEIEEGKAGWFTYLKTRNFWIVLLLG